MFKFAPFQKMKRKPQDVLLRM